MKAEAIYQYQCVGCELWHDSLDGADECCTDKMQTRTICSVCKEELSAWDRKNDHLERCSSEDEVVTDNFGLPLITKDELEAAGQQRLQGIY